MVVIDRPRAVVEQHGSEFVVLLCGPSGSREYYVATGVSAESDNKVYPYVSSSVLKAKHFADKRNAEMVAGDMTQFLSRQYQHLPRWT